MAANRLARTWTRFRRWFLVLVELGSRQQVTRTGLVFSLACTLIGLAAFASANNLLFLILAAMLATLLVSGFVSRLTLAGLELEMDVPEHIAAGRKVIGRVRVRNAKRWMASFSVRLAGIGQGMKAPLYFPVIGGGRLIQSSVDLLFPRRGSYRDNKFLFSTRFPFGFAERRMPVHFRNEVVVYPSIDPPEGLEDLMLSLAGDLQAQVRGLGNDFYRIRPYEVLESARHVDWKATAHTGDLQVREFAREEDAAVEIYLDLDLDLGHEAWMEKAISCCAFLAWRLNENDSRFRFRTADFEFNVPADGLVHLVLRYLALAETLPGKPLEAPRDPRHLLVIFSRDPERLAAAGWDLNDSRTVILPLS
jgi:uncharacterized protein (DUF58 family)